MNFSDVQNSVPEKIPGYNPEDVEDLFPIWTEDQPEMWNDLNSKGLELPPNYFKDIYEGVINVWLKTEALHTLQHNGKRRENGRDKSNDLGVALWTALVVAEDYLSDEAYALLREAQEYGPNKVPEDRNVSYYHTLNDLDRLMRSELGIAETLRDLQTRYRYRRGKPEEALKIRSEEAYWHQRAGEILQLALTCVLKSAVLRDKYEDILEKNEERQAKELEAD